MKITVEIMMKGMEELKRKEIRSINNKVGIIQVSMSK